MGSLLFFLSILVGGGLPAHSQRLLHDIPGLGVRHVESNFDFETTSLSLVELISTSPSLTLVESIDHSAAAAKVNLTLSPLQVVVVRSPANDGAILEQNSYAGLDLPHKIVVYQQQSTTFIGYNSKEYLTERYSLHSANSALDNVDSELQRIVETAANNMLSTDSLFPLDLHSVAHSPGLFDAHSLEDFDTTWSMLMGRIEASPASIAFTINHSSDAGRSQLVVFGNPSLGTPLMQESSTTGIDLPLKILVVEYAGTVHMVTNTAEFLQRRHELSNLPGLTTISTVVENFLSPFHTHAPSLGPHTHVPTASPPTVGPHTHVPTVSWAPHTHVPKSPSSKKESNSPKSTSSPETSLPVAPSAAPAVSSIEDPPTTSRSGESPSLCLLSSARQSLFIVVGATLLALLLAQ